MMLAAAGSMLSTVGAAVKLVSGPTCDRGKRAYRVHAKLHTRWTRR